jgi:hypothetical protein
MKKLGCDHITIRNLGINQPIKVDQVDIAKELKKRGYKLYDEVPFGVLRDIAEYSLDIIVNQDLDRIEFYGAVYGYGGMYEDQFGENYSYELVATMETYDTDKNGHIDGHLEDICAFAKHGFEKAEFPADY